MDDKVFNVDCITLRTYISSLIYKKIGIQPYLSKYLDYALLMGLSSYDICMSIIKDKNYIRITITDDNLNTREDFVKAFVTYTDIDNIIDQTFQNIKPSKMY